MELDKPETIPVPEEISVVIAESAIHNMGLLKLGSELDASIGVKPLPEGGSKITAIPLLLGNRIITRAHLLGALRRIHYTPIEG